MRLILAVSETGILARGRDDNMRWTGPDDKTVFRLLTMTSGGVCLAGMRTYQMLPELKGRTVLPLSRTRDGMTLEEAEALHPNAWLLGGVDVAESALRAGLVTEAYLCWNQAHLPLDDQSSLYHVSRLTRFMPPPTESVRAREVRVDCYRWPAK